MCLDQSSPRRPKATKKSRLDRAISRPLMGLPMTVCARLMKMEPSSLKVFCKVSAVVPVVKRSQELSSAVFNPSSSPGSAHKVHRVSNSSVGNTPNSKGFTLPPMMQDHLDVGGLPINDQGWVRCNVMMSRSVVVVGREVGVVAAARLVPQMMQEPSSPRQLDRSCLPVHAIRCHE